MTWPLTHYHVKLINTRHYQCQCVFQIGEQSLQCKSRISYSHQKQFEDRITSRFAKIPNFDKNSYVIRPKRSTSISWISPEKYGQDWWFWRRPIYHFLLILLPWPLAQDLEILTLALSQCVCQIWEQSILGIWVSPHLYTELWAMNVWRFWCETMMSPNPSDTGDTNINTHIISFFNTTIQNGRRCPAFAKLYSRTLANNSILAGVQYIFIHKILPQHRPLSN